MFNIQVAPQMLLWIHANADLLLHFFGLFFQVNVAVRSAVLIFFPFVKSSWNRVWFPLQVLDNVQSLTETRHTILGLYFLDFWIITVFHAKMQLQFINVQLGNRIGFFS